MSLLTQLQRLTRRLATELRQPRSPQPPHPPQAGSIQGWVSACFVKSENGPGYWQVRHQHRLVHLYRLGCGHYLLIWSAALPAAQYFVWHSSGEATLTVCAQHPRYLEVRCERAGQASDNVPFQLLLLHP